MKTGKEITKEEMHEVLTEEHYSLMFEKKSAKLFVNVMPSTKAVNFSVFNRVTTQENRHELLAGAVSEYNQMP